MKKLVITSTLLLAGTLWAADKITPLNVKPGLWETKSTASRAGAIPVPAETLARLTPEQRARLEARMKANANVTSTNTSKSCVTQKDLEKSPNFLENKKDCSYTVLTSTSTQAKGKFSCQENGYTATGMVDVEAIDPENVKGTTHSTMSANGQSMQFDGSFVSKWLGPNCGDVK